MKSSDIPVGTIFKGTINGNADTESIYIRSKNAIVDLKEPMNDYSIGSLFFYDYEPIEQSFEPFARSLPSYLNNRSMEQSMDVANIPIGQMFVCSHIRHAGCLIDKSFIFLRSYGFIINLCNYQDWCIMDDDLEISSDLVVENYLEIKDSHESPCEFLRNDKRIVDLI